MKAISDIVAFREDTRIQVDPKTGCWIWCGDKNADGYGFLSIGGKRQYAHRMTYSLFRSGISFPMQLDHLCRNPTCCNPWHLELVTSRENSLRGNHPLFAVHRSGVCRKGHRIEGENVARRGDGRPRCRQCVLQYQRERRARLCGR